VERRHRQRRGQVDRPFDPLGQQQRSVDHPEGVGGHVLRQGHAALHPTGARRALQLIPVQQQLKQAVYVHKKMRYS